MKWGKVEKFAEQIRLLGRSPTMPGEALARQFKPEVRTPSEGEGEVWRRSRHPEGETFSTENASTIRQFCFAKLPGGRSRSEGAVSGFAAGK